MHTRNIEVENTDNQIRVISADCDYLLLAVLMAEMDHLRKTQPGIEFGAISRTYTCAHVSFRLTS